MKKVWDEFIDISNNGTLFHKQSFLNYHIQRKFSDSSLLFYKKKHLVAVLPAALVQKSENKILISHPGASFGGIVLQRRSSFALIQEIVKALDEYLVKQDFFSAILIQSPSIYYLNRDDSLNYILKFNQYSVIENYISHYTNIGSTRSIYNSINKRKSRYIKNLLKSNQYQIVTSDDFATFYNILLKSKKKFNSIPTHSLSELNALRQKFHNNIQLLVSKQNNVIVGGVLLFYPTAFSCLVFYNVVDPLFRNSQLATFQLYHAAKQAKNNKCSVLDFGVSHTPEKQNPLHPKFSLIRFKEQFGAKGCFRFVYQKNLNNE